MLWGMLSHAVLVKEQFSRPPCTGSAKKYGFNHITETAKTFKNRLKMKSNTLHIGKLIKYIGTSQDCASKLKCTSNCL